MKNAFCTLIFHSEKAGLLDLFSPSQNISIHGFSSGEDGHQNFNSIEQLKECILKNNMILTGIKAKFLEERWRAKMFTFVDDAMTVKSNGKEIKLCLADMSSNFQNIAWQLDMPISDKLPISNDISVIINAGENEFGKIHFFFNSDAGAEMNNGIPKQTIVLDKVQL